MSVDDEKHCNCGFYFKVGYKTVRTFLSSYGVKLG